MGTQSNHKFYDDFFHTDAVKLENLRVEDEGKISIDIVVTEAVKINVCEHCQCHCVCTATSWAPGLVSIEFLVIWLALLLNTLPSLFMYCVNRPFPSFLLHVCAHLWLHAPTKCCPFQPTTCPDFLHGPY